jgi:glutathione S-transferase
LAGEKFEEMKAAFLEAFSAKVSNLATQLGEKQFFCGDAVAFCDFAVYHHLDQATLLDAAALEEHPTMIAFMERVGALPHMKEYLDSRPDAVDIGTKPMLRPKM